MSHRRRRHLEIRPMLAPGHYKVTIAGIGLRSGSLPTKTSSTGTVAEIGLPPQTKGDGHRGHRARRAASARGHAPHPRAARDRRASRAPTATRCARSKTCPASRARPASPGLLIVRGSAPQDTQTFVDGTFVPLVYHFGGLSSVVPTEMLEKIDFYPGNFSAQYGRVMGGIVDVGIRSPNKDGKYHGLAQVDLIDGRVLAEGPIPGLKNWSFLVGGSPQLGRRVARSRCSTQAGAGVTSAPVYYDYQVFVETKPTSALVAFALGVFGSDDALEVLIRDPASKTRPSAATSPFAPVSIASRPATSNDISDALKFSTVASYGLDRFDFGLGTFFFQSETTTLLNRSELSYKPWGRRDR